MFWQTLHDSVVALLHVERRFEPWFRAPADRLLREPGAALIQHLINARRHDEGLAIAEERAQPDEEQHLQAIIETMADYMRRHWPPGNFQRAGNTKTHALVRGTVTIRDDLPDNFRQGVFAEPRTYPAWVRFSGPGPDWPRDIDDVGFVSCAIKLMGVPGEKLLGDEVATQDFLSICTPTFVTPDTRANAKLQAWILKGRPLFYFTQPGDSHLLDGLMQAWWNKTQSNPLGERYWSCVPYLLGEGQAMMYSLYPRSVVDRRIPRLPRRPPDNYLRDNMVRTLDRQDVDFDIMLQLQTDAFRMPIENAAVRWPERLSPFVAAARLHIPRQTFAGPEQLAFADNLSFNPWHCLPEHRPLGNQSRARRRMYDELSRYRQRMNGKPHIEPTGAEVFNNDDDADTHFARTLRDELRAVRPDIAAPQNATLDGLRAAIDGTTQPLAALCLSGGGIRSASFALGVLQTLARYGVLSEFDYLSTVSGGGYIGSFLTAWRHHAGDDAVRAGLDRRRAPDGAEAAELAGVRADGNYLTPRLGVLSADTWGVLALYIRNLLLNWLVFLPFFMGVLLIPWFCKHALDAIALRAAGAWAWGGLAVGVFTGCAGLAVASYGRRRAAGRWVTDKRFMLLVLCPIVIAAVGFSAAAAAFVSLHPGEPWLPMQVVFGAAVAGAISYALSWSVAGVFYPERMAADRQPQPGSAVREFVVWAAAGVLTGVVLAQGIWFAAACSMRWLAVLGIGWTMLSIYAGELFYVGLRSYSPRGDMDREWLARAAGWLGAWAVSWGVVAAVALFGPRALQATEIYVVGAVGGISGLTTLILGGGTATAATNATRLAGRLSLTQIASAAALVFALMLAILISWLDAAAGRLLVTLPPGGVARPVLDLVGAAVLILFSAAASSFVNVNRFSLHAVYRNRLVRAFLGSARRGDAAGRKPDPFTGFDPQDNPNLSDMPTQRPLHVVNVALNVVSTDNLAWQERKAEAFTLTPLHAGNPLVGYRPTRAFGGPDGGISLGTAMAISGAAVSPNMGYHSSPLLGFLLMLFNVRLGWWLGNPAHDDYGRAGPRFGLVTLLQELANQTTADGRWIYLSDGGHFDNLGIYEMVRRRCRCIVVSDAGCDPEATLADLGNAVRKVSIDFGVRIAFDAFDVSANARPPAKGAAAAWIGTIFYPGSAEPGWLLYLRPTFRGNETADIRAYAAANASFPHESTSEQWFGESQFEAYRALGEHQMELICGHPAEDAPLELDLAGLRRAAERYVALPPVPLPKTCCQPICPKDA